MITHFDRLGKVELSEEERKLLAEARVKAAGVAQSGAHPGERSGQ